MSEQLRLELPTNLRRTGAGEERLEEAPQSSERAEPELGATGLDRLLTAREVGERLGLSTATVLDWFEAGRLPGFRLGGRIGGPVHFHEPDVLRLLESWRVGPRPALRPSA